MTWSPPQNVSRECSLNSTQAICQPEALAFLAFVVQYLSYSHDTKFSDTTKLSNHSIHEEIDNDYDFIIIGAGSAGCVLANRLSEIKHWKVLLLEAGDEEPIITDIPALMGLTSSGSINYGYKTQPEPFACAADKDKSCYWPRGKVMGGSSTVNAMWYARGVSQDYDLWAKLGNEGWNYEDVLPYFKKSEKLKSPITAEQSDSHGYTGYQNVEYFPYLDKNVNTILKAWKEYGMKEIDYLTGKDIIGTSRLLRATINGARQSANGAYIRPIRGRRENLKIRPNSHVTKIIIDKITKRALGVEYLTKDMEMKTVYAKKEVIVSAGVIDSPKLLMLSGLGPTDELNQANISIIKNLPGVGQNLHDHVNVASFSIPLDYNTSVIGNYQDAQNDLTYWLNTHQGPASHLNLADTVTYLQTPHETTPGVPDIQLSLGGRNTGRFTNGTLPWIPGIYYDQLSMTTTLLTPKSRGEIKLNKTDPTFGSPLIYANYLTHPDDIKTAISGIKLLRKLFDTETFKKKGWKEEPMSECSFHQYDTEEYYSCILQYYSSTGFHPVGTCKMGQENDTLAVVDPSLKVYGVYGLRVIDASIMPVLVRGNTHGPVIMIAEKASDIIKKEWRL